MKDIPVRSIQPPTPSFDSFKIRSLKTVLAGSDMQQDLHRHDFYFILSVTHGEGLHTIDFIDYSVSDNTVFVMRPGQVHKLYLKAGSDGYLLEFKKDFQLLSPGGTDVLRKVATTNCRTIHQSVFTAVDATMQTMLDEFTTRQEGYQHAIKAALELLLVHLLRTKTISQKDQQVTSENMFRQEKLQEFLDLLESNITTTKQVAAYADMLNLSHFQLNAATKSLLGKTATELIDDQILLEAKRYLLATSNQVNQIADHLGYEDVSYFIRFFKKHTGHSPEAFRQNFR